MKDKPIAGTPGFFGRLKTLLTKLYIFGMLFFLAFCFIGFPIMLVVQWGMGNKKNERAGEWPWTQGEVLECRIQGRSRSKQSSTVRYTPKVHYAYQWEGQRYESRNVSAGELFLSKSEAEQLVKSDFAVGKTIKVFVNPNDPSDSLLMARSSLVARQSIWHIVGGCGFLTLILALVFLGIRNRSTGETPMMEKSDGPEKIA